MRRRISTRPWRSPPSSGSRSSASCCTARWAWPRAGGRRGRTRCEGGPMKRARLVILALGLAAAAAGAPEAQQAQKVVFALNWFAVGDHAAYWVALEKGYYKARGLDVELQNSKGSGDSLAKVDTHRADVGLADAAVVIPRIAQGARVKIVGAVFDHTPLNFWMWTSSGITRPKDLEGKTLAAPPGDAQRQLFPAFAKLHGIDTAKVKWLSIEPAAKFVSRSEERRVGKECRSRGGPGHGKKKEHETRDK